MANNMVGDIEGLGFVNKQRTGVAGSSGQSGVGTIGDFADITSLRAALTAINAAYYTSTRLDRLTVNDMVYALRMERNGTSNTGSV